jgi:hypothetical protein
MNNYELVTDQHDRNLHYIVLRHLGGYREMVHMLDNMTYSEARIAFNNYIQSEAQ